MLGIPGSPATTSAWSWCGSCKISVSAIEPWFAQRRAEQQQLLVELFRIQDLVAAEIARAHVQVRSADARVTSAERGLREASLAYEGSLVEMGKVQRDRRTSDTVVRRAFEVIDALKSLSAAYDTYFQSINDYNRAQFRLYRSLGCPAELLTCERAPGADPAGGYDPPGPDGSRLRLPTPARRPR